MHDQRRLTATNEGQISFAPTRTWVVQWFFTFLVGANNIRPVFGRAIPPWLPIIYRHQAAYFTHPGQKTLIYLINRMGKGIG
jgi:hypothetical protein